MSASPIPTTKADGLRMLKCIRDSGVVEPLEAKLGQAPGPRSSVTVPMLLLGTLLCGLTMRQRRSDLLRVLAGLHDEVAREVGLLDRDGNRITCQPKAVFQQTMRIERELTEGWTAMENGIVVLHDLPWFAESLIRASVPADVWAAVAAAAANGPDTRPDSGSASGGSSHYPHGNLSEPPFIVGMAPRPGPPNGVGENTRPMLERCPTLLNRQLGLAANTIAAVALVVAYNLSLTH